MVGWMRSFLLFLLFWRFILELHIHIHPYIGFSFLDGLYCIALRFELAL
jgi:hypothetical protein